MLKKLLIAATMMASTTTAQAMDTSILNTIQHQVNNSIKYKKESGENDYWQIPNKSGDCEDIALLKRKLLIDAGWNATDLQILLLVDTEQFRNKRIADGHVVLYVKSQNVILDMPNIIPFKKQGIPQPVMDYSKYLDNQNYTLFCVIDDISLGQKYDAISKRCTKIKYVLK